MNQRRLFIASCLSLVVTAMIFALRGNVEDLILADPNASGYFNDPSSWLLTLLSSIGVSAVGPKSYYALLSTMAFFGFAASILVTSPMLDALPFDRTDRGGRRDSGDTTTNMPMLIIQADQPLPQLMERVKQFLASPQGIMSNDFGIRERIDELVDAGVERGLQRRFANAT